MIMFHNIFFSLKHAEINKIFYFSSNVSILKFRIVMLQSTEIVFLCAMFFFTL